MNLRFIEAFVWIARLKSFKRASEQLHATQAAISSRISTLEDELGTRLFERDRRTVELSHQGRALLPLAEKLLACSEQLKMAARFGAREELSPSVRIGAIDTVASTWLPDMLGGFAKLYPRGVVEVLTDTSAALREELIRGRVDCSIQAECIDDPDIDSQPVTEYPVVWVCSPALDLPTTGMTLEDISDLPILALRRQSIIHRNLMKLASARVRSRVSLFSTLSTLVALAKAGHGVAPIPLASVYAEVQSRELLVISVAPALPPLQVFVSIRAERRSQVFDDIVALTLSSCREWGAARTDLLRPHHAAR
jgi:DNA-binding transcriptional LysR family regulator